MTGAQWFDLVVVCALGGLIACVVAALLWGWLRAVLELVIPRVREALLYWRWKRRTRRVYSWLRDIYLPDSLARFFKRGAP
jgi:hypothetical protein